MNQILINELRDVNRNIGRLDISEKDMKAVMNSLDKAFETYEHVIRKGLMKLDDWLSNHAAEMMCFDAIFPLVDLVTTGAETDKMEELFEIIYFANERSNVERLLLLVYYTVLDSMRRGDEYCYLVDKVTAMLPGKISCEYVKRAYHTVAEYNKRTEASFYAEITEAAFPWDETDECYDEISYVNDVLVRITDQEMKEWLQCMRNVDIAVMLKGLSGDVRKKILKSVSTKLSAMLMEDMRFMGSVNKENMSLVIFQGFVKLVKNTVGGEDIF